MNTSAVNTSITVHTTYDREMRSLLKKLKSDTIPSVATLRRILELTTSCKTAAFELLSIINLSLWKGLKSWSARSILISKAEGKEIRKLLVEIMTELLKIGFADIKRDPKLQRSNSNSTAAASSITSEARPLSNITNTYMNNKAGKSLKRKN